MTAGPRTQFPARRSRGGDLALPVAGVLLFAALAALLFGASRAPGATMVALCVIAAILAVAGAVLLPLALAYRRLSYTLGEGALSVEWLGGTTLLPYAAIQGIYGGQRLQGNATAQAPRWPGINVGPARVRGLGPLRFFATSTDQSLLTFITVEHGGIIISADNPTAFQTSLIEHVEQSNESEVSATWRSIAPRTAPWTALHDRWFFVCVGLGTLIVLGVLAAIGLRYDALPDQVPLHFDATGQTSQIAPKSDLLRLPLLGLIVLFVNWGLGVFVHPPERTLARLLWLSGAVVQVVLLLGVIRLIG